MNYLAKVFLKNLYLKIAFNSNFDASFIVSTRSVIQIVVPILHNHHLISYYSSYFISTIVSHLEYSNGLQKRSPH